MIYTDERIGDTPRYILTDSPEDFMDIPQEVKKCVLFLGYERADGVKKLVGTAFLVYRDIEGLGGGFSYAVTARHVIDGIRDKLGLDSVLLRVNQKSGNAKWIKTAIKDWHSHPAGKFVDVSVLQYSPTDDLEHFSFPLKEIVTEQVIKKERIYGGSDVFIMGLFHPHYGEQNNIPIVRVGNIAAMPVEKVKTRLGPMDAYLIEARSIGGLSGSPVFVPFGAMRSGGFATTPSQHFRFYLLGLMHGHFDVTEDDLTDDFIPSVEDAITRKNVNMGIAIVIPIEKVIEAIRQPKIAEEEDAMEKEKREKNLPVMDSVPDDGVFTKEDFESALRKVSRKLTPEDRKKLGDSD